MQLNPTDEIYNELQSAYRHFNEHLFHNQLPGCLFTLQRKSNTLGYYSPTRFLRRDARGKSDEIALNPAFFAYRSIEKTLSTLLHEMVHQWQAHFGKVPRRGYHDRQWADKMEGVGLMPSHTGAPGGRRHGQQMTHYIIAGGIFESVCAELLANGGMISWVDIAAKRVPGVLVGLLNPGADEPVDGGDGPLTALKAAGLLPPSEPGQDKKLKRKYSCPACHANVWGKPGLRIACCDCERAFAEQ